jgi:hypothetical protein
MHTAHRVDIYPRHTPLGSPAPAPRAQQLHETVPGGIRRATLLLPCSATIAVSLLPFGPPVGFVRVPINAADVSIGIHLATLVDLVERWNQWSRRSRRRSTVGGAGCAVGTGLPRCSTYCRKVKIGRVRRVDRIVQETQEKKADSEWTYTLTATLNHTLTLSLPPFESSLEIFSSFIT